MNTELEAAREGIRERDAEINRLRTLIITAIRTLSSCDHNWDTELVTARDENARLRAALAEAVAELKLLKDMLHVRPGEACVVDGIFFKSPAPIRSEAPARGEEEKSDGQ